MLDLSEKQGIFHDTRKYYYCKYYICINMGWKGFTRIKILGWE